MPEISNSTQPNRFIGGLLILAGGIIILFLMSEIYNLLQSAHQAPFITSFLDHMSKNANGLSFTFVSNYPDVKVNFSGDISYILALLLNIVVFYLVAGIAKALISFGTSLYRNTIDN